jgi:exodeoxyribonuclease VII small subunit
MPRQKPDADVAAPTYEEALAELEGLVQRMEAGQMPLEQMLNSYKRGAELLQLCRSRLAAVEQQVKLLDGAQLKPWSPGGDGPR